MFTNGSVSDSGVVKKAVNYTVLHWCELHHNEDHSNAFQNVVIYFKRLFRDICSQLLVKKDSFGLLLHFKN